MIKYVLCAVGQKQCILHVYDKYSLFTYRSWLLFGVDKRKINVTAGK